MQRWKTNIVRPKSREIPEKTHTIMLGSIYYLIIIITIHKYLVYCMSSIMWSDE